MEVNQQIILKVYDRNIIREIIYWCSKYYIKILYVKINVFFSIDFKFVHIKARQISLAKVKYKLKMDYKTISCQIIKL